MRYTQTKRRVRTDREAWARDRTRRRHVATRGASERGGHAGGAAAGTLGRRGRQVKSNPPCWGGERAGMRAGSSVGRPRWARILVTVVESSMVAAERLPRFNGLAGASSSTCTTTRSWWKACSRSRRTAPWASIPRHRRARRFRRTPRLPRTGVPRLLGLWSVGPGFCTFSVRRLSRRDARPVRH